MLQMFVSQYLFICYSVYNAFLPLLITRTHSSRNSLNISSVMPSSVLIVQFVFYESIYNLHKLYCICLSPPLDNELLGAERISYLLAPLANPAPLQVLECLQMLLEPGIISQKKGFSNLTGHKNFLRTL